MIKEKSKTRLTKLEKKLPSSIREDTVIPITKEAQELLQPYADAFERLDGQTLYFKRPEREGCIYENTPEKDSEIVNEALWIRTMGRCLALAAGNEEGDTGINEDIARAMIVIFQEYGITV